MSNCPRVRPHDQTRSTNANAESALSVLCHTVAPNSFEERCVKLVAGQSLRYRVENAAAS